MKYKAGDKVRIVDYTLSSMNNTMSKFVGNIVTIAEEYEGFYRIEEDGRRYWWRDEMIAGKAKEEEHSSEYYLMKYFSAKLSEKEAELNAKLAEIKKIQEEIKKVLDNESEM